MGKFFQNPARLLVLLFASTAIVGCNNLSPRDNLSPQMKQQLDKIQGNQTSLENMQDAIKVELARLQNSLEMSNSNDNKVQQGWFNFQSDGILVLIFGVIVVGMLIKTTYDKEKLKTKYRLISEQVKYYDDDALRERIMSAAWNSGLEKDIYHSIVK